MRQFLTLPILVPIVLGIALLILQPKSRRVRSIYIMAASLATTALSLACIVLTYLYGSGFLACIMVRFNEAFSISLRIDGASMVYGAIVSVLWPLVTAYSLDYMSHEGHENRFFAFWLMAYGVVLGIAYSEDFLTLYFFYEVLTLTTLPLVMHAMDEKARYAGRKYLVYSLSGAAFAFIGIVFLLNYGVGHLNFTYGGTSDRRIPEWKTGTDHTGTSEDTGWQCRMRQTEIRAVFEIILYFALVACITFLIIHFVGQRTVVNGVSMQPTLSDGDNLIVDKLSYRFHDPDRFDIIVFPQEDGRYFIKRIIGLSGENVRIDEDGFIYINGKSCRNHMEKK